jgi:hypothetical protein
MLTHEAEIIRFDDEIFEHTLREFPELAAAPHAGLVKLDEDWIKSKEGKERWRAFIAACVIPDRLRLLWLLSHMRTDMRGKLQTLILAR